MRVIAGKYRSLQLKHLEGPTRPTTDKNKEMMFNMLGQFFDGGIAVDLFAGSGALGIEALSRGIDECIFVETSKPAIQCIRENLATCKIPPTVGQIRREDGLVFLKSFSKKIDLLLLDPPYQMGYYPQLIDILSSNTLFQPHALVLFESLKEEFLPATIGQLRKVKERLTGISKITIYRMEESL